MRKKVLSASIVTIFLFLGCSQIKYKTVTLGKEASPKPAWVLTETVNVKIQSCSTVCLKSNTNWIYVGEIEQGDVYKTKDQIVTIECTNMFEANIVLSGDKIVGFYLPFEKGFSQASKQVKVNRNIIN